MTPEVLASLTQKQGVPSQELLLSGYVEGDQVALQFLNHFY